MASDLGLGYAEKAYELIPEIIENGITMVSSCPCEDGCAACVGDYHLDKSMVLWGLRNMLEESEVPKHVKMAPYGPSTFIQKPFRFDELEAQWKAFTSMLLKNGEPFASFLNTVTGVRTEERRLALITDQPFYREWIMEETNRKALHNLISYYTDAPVGFELEVEIRKKGENRRNGCDMGSGTAGEKAGNSGEGSTGIESDGFGSSEDDGDMRRKLEQRLDKLKKKEN